MPGPSASVQAAGLGVAMDVRWEEVCYTPLDPITKVRTTVLRSVSGRVGPGRPLAIMGPSGAGKTSLLSVLAGKVRRKQGLLGQVRYGGQPLSAVRSEVSVVEQHDLFIAALTVHEHLQFHANLRLHQLSRQEKETKIDEVLASVGLLDCKTKRILVLSGGEKKRLAVAEELLNEPSVLLLDEPTSGLDSHMAAQVVKGIQTLAKESNKTVAFTIHQPSSELFSTFEEVMLLAKGRVAYCGPGHLLAAHLASFGKHCPVGYSVAEFALSVLADKEATSDSDLDAICDAVATCPVHAPEEKGPVRQDEESCEVQLEAQEGEEELKQVAEHPMDVQLVSSRKAAPWLTEVAAIVRRTYIQRTRQRLQTRLNYLNTLLICLFTGIIYWQVPKDQTSVRNRTGATFLLFLQPVFSAIFETAMPLVNDGPTLQREYKAKHLYRVTSYYLARTTGELLIQMSFPLLYAILIYWMVYADSWAQFALMTLTLLLACFTGASYGYMLSTFASDLDIFMSLNVVFVVVLFLFSGLMLDVSMLPPYVVWLQNISVFKWSFEAALILVWEGQTIGCTLEGEAARQLCLYSTGEEVLATFGIAEDLVDATFIRALVMLLALALIARLIGFCRLYMRYVYDDDLRVALGIRKLEQ